MTIATSAATPPQVAGANPTRRPRRSLAAACCGLVALATVSACGGESDNTEALAGLKTSPIKVMTIGNWTQPSAGTENPEYPAGAQARALQINKQGGIGGHPVDVIVCSDENDPNIALRCARDAVNQKVAAVVGLQTPNDKVILPVLEQAGIPAVGVYPFTSIAFTSKVSFPDVAGVYAIIGGMPHALAAAGAHRVSLLYPGGSAGANLFQQQWDPSVKAAGLVSTGQVSVPAKAHDLSAVVAAGTKGSTDGVAGVSLDAEAGLVQAMRQQAPKVNFATTTFNLSDQVIKALGPVAEGVLAAETTVPASSTEVTGVKQFRSDLSGFKSSLPASNIGLHEWLAMYTFEQVAKPLKAVNAATVLSAMGQLDKLDMAGIIPPLTTTQPATTDPTLPRLFNPTAVIEVVKQGKWTLLDGGQSPFVDVFTGKPIS
jgi:ABC-type branched-subunit amino acid transport system substrate-binding protein